MYQLFACGFNAHSQLAPPTAPAEPDIDLLPADLSVPTQVAIASVSLRVLFAGWSDTLLEIDGTLYLRGALAGGRHEIKIQNTLLPAKDITTAFGDHTGPQGVISDFGDVFLLSFDNPTTTTTTTSSNDDDDSRTSNTIECKLTTSSIKNIQSIAIAGNGQVCVLQKYPQTLTHHPTLSSFLSSPPDSSPTITKLPCPPLTTSLKPTATHFTLLTASSSSSLYTFGDPRHPLGRTPTPLHPADKPAPISSLLTGLEFKKIAAGGWVTAAVSAERDLYVWGGKRGGLASERVLGLPVNCSIKNHSGEAKEKQKEKEKQEEEEEEVLLVEFKGGEMVDVEDVAVGSGHVVVLDTAGRVWSAGGGEYGQLGESWPTEKNGSGPPTKEELILWDGEWIGGGRRKVKGVECAPWATFLIVEC